MVATDPNVRYYTPTIDPEIKELWTTALRSDAFLQGKKSLKIIRRDELGKRIIRHCCLGVLCEITGMEELPSSCPNLYDLDFGFPDDPDDHNSTVLPYQLAAGVGFISDSNSPMVNPSFYYPDNLGNTQSHSLADLNDAGLTFSQIADVIDYFF